MKERTIRILYTLFLSFAPIYPMTIIGMISQPKGWVPILCIVMLLGLFFIYPVWRISKNLITNQKKIIPN